MAMHYRLGWPFGLVVARMRCPIAIRVDIIRDDEAGVYVGTSADLAGLVVEAETLDALKREAKEVITTLLEINHGLVPADSVTKFRYNDNYACA